MWREAGAAPGDLAVDVGGGRGGLAQVWAQAGARAVVVDLSPTMLAACPPEVRGVGARAEHLPVADGSASVVLFHMSLHHTVWRTALGEAARVLAPGGRLGTWTMHPDDGRHTFMARWFPSVPDIEATRFPHPDAIAAALEAAGLQVIEAGREQESVTRTAAEWRAAVDARFISTIQLLDPGELASGLAAFDAAYPDPRAPLRYPRRFACIIAASTRRPRSPRSNEERYSRDAVRGSAVKAE